MALNRVWFINAPSGTIDILQRAQLGIGYSLYVAPPVPVVIVGSLIDINISYFRNYMLDLAPRALTGFTPIIDYALFVDKDLPYFKRYNGVN